MSRIRLLVGACFLAVACSAGPSAPTDVARTPTAAPAGPTQPGSQRPDASTPATSPGPPASAPPAVTTTPGPGATSRAAELGLAEIEQLTPLAGAGRRPVLEWVAVPNAAHYHIIVRAPSGQVYWGWRTSDTSVPVGGLPQLNADAAGPAISAGMTWSVSAVDAEGRVIGLSGHQPISP